MKLWGVGGGWGGGSPGLSFGLERFEAGPGQSFQEEELSCQVAAPGVPGISLREPFTYISWWEGSSQVKCMGVHVQRVCVLPSCLRVKSCLSCIPQCGELVLLYAFLVNTYKLGWTHLCSKGYQRSLEETPGGALHTTSSPKV